MAAQKVTVVDKGILKNFLMSRSPVAGFEQSNGHGRKAPGYRTVGRQGNLIVQASNTVSDAKLRAMLIDEAKKQGKTFGLLFQRYFRRIYDDGPGEPAVISSYADHGLPDLCRWAA